MVQNLSDIMVSTLRILYNFFIMHLGVTVLGPSLSSVKQKHNMLSSVNTSVVHVVILLVGYFHDIKLFALNIWLACLNTQQRSRVLKIEYSCVFLFYSCVRD
jgi:hypothetical membrane protein